jgi:hypothetical protein
LLNKSISAARNNEAEEIERGRLRAPMVSPIPRSINVLLDVGTFSKPGCNLGEREVIDGILNGSSNSATISWSYVSKFKPWVTGELAFLD